MRLIYYNSAKAVKYLGITIEMSVFDHVFLISTTSSAIAEKPCDA